MHRLGAATVVHTVAGRGSVGNLLDAKTASQETSIEPRLAALAAKTARLVNAVIDESQNLKNQINYCFVRNLSRFLLQQKLFR